MKNALQSRLAIFIFLSTCIALPGVHAQSLLYTSWRAVGQTGQSFKQSGIDTLFWQFVPNGHMYWRSAPAGPNSTIYALWTQTGAHSFTFSFQDTSANNSQLTSFCPAMVATNISAYHISGDTLYLDAVSGGCGVITSLLASSTWKATGGLSVAGAPGSDAAITVYPLPAQNTAYVTTGDYFTAATTLTLSLYDNTGRKVQELHSSPGTIQLRDIDRLPPGVYALHIVSDAGLTATRRLVIGR